MTKYVLKSLRRRRRRSSVSLHVDHANKALSAPMTILRIPMMRLTLVSVEKPRGVREIEDDIESGKVIVSETRGFSKAFQ